MCGIAGIYDFNSGMLPDMAFANLIAVRDTMMHRGPDASGYWKDSKNRCFLAHRRLSIIDTSSYGNQPMVSANGRWVITFNGELYNFLELRSLLEAKVSLSKGKVIQRFFSKRLRYGELTPYINLMVCTHLHYLIHLRVN